MQISEPGEYAILGLLESQPMHGYEIFQQFESGTLCQIVRLEMSQMYAFLKKLERLGYLESQVEAQGVRPPRKIFHLTTSGRETFRHWLTQPVERPREIHLLFLIKLYFVQRIMPHQSAHLIHQQITAGQSFLKRLESQHPANPETTDLAFFDHIVLRSRIHHTRALLDWLQELQHELAETH